MIKSHQFHPERFVTPHMYAREKFRRANNGRSFNSVDAPDRDWEMIERFESDWNSYFARRQWRS